MNQAILMLDPTAPLEDKMDDNPKTRSEKKGKKSKDSPYSAKHVRIAQALQESKASKSQPTKKPSLG